MSTTRAPLHEADGHPPLVLVTWRDAHFDLEQGGPGPARSDYLVRTAGFLLSEGPRFLSVAAEILPHDDGYRAVTHVPLSVVERVEVLTLGGLAHLGTAV